MMLAACASGPEPGHDGDPHATTAAWFALDGPACEPVLAAVARAATKLGTTRPEPHHVEQAERWCVFTPESPPAGPAVRSDGVAQRASAASGKIAIAFWVSPEGWSYATFERGEPVLAMESHYGPPSLIGDTGRGETLLGLPNGTATNVLANARDPAAADAFATRIGAARPSAHAPFAKLPTLVPDADPAAFDPHRHPPSPRLEAGQWAVLPPLGVVLVKSVDKNDAGAETYTLIDEDNVFPIPVERAGGLGMRRLATAEDVAKALKLVLDGVDVARGATDYSAEKAQAWLDTLKLGDLQKIARTYAELCAMSGERNLFAVEEGLLATSREWLAEEISTVQNTTRDGLEQKLSDACD